MIGGFRVIRVVSFVAIHRWLLPMLTLTSHYGLQHTEQREGLPVWGIAQWTATSVTCVMILAMNSCSKRPSMSPISRLTDCQVGWLWTEETAVKITPLPRTLCSPQGASVVAARLCVFLVLWLCEVAVFAWCEFSSLSTFFPTPDSRVGNMLWDQFMEFTELAVGGLTKAECFFG